MKKSIPNTGKVNLLLFHDCDLNSFNLKLTELHVTCFFPKKNITVPVFIKTYLLLVNLPDRTFEYRKPSANIRLIIIFKSTFKQKKLLKLSFNFRLQKMPRNVFKSVCRNLSALSPQSILFKLKYMIPLLLEIGGTHVFFGGP